jgi:hypothetical protein
LVPYFDWILSTITEIQDAIAQLPPRERSALAVWLRSQDEMRMSESEEAALLAALDKAADELDDGRGVPAARVREMVGQWLTK